MPQSNNEIVVSALALPTADRVLLAVQLMESVEKELPGWSADDPGFETELEKRLNDGQPTVGWEQVRGQLERDLES